MCAKHYEKPTMLSRVTAKNVGDVFFETHCTVSSNDKIFLNYVIIIFYYY